MTISNFYEAGSRPLESNALDAVYDSLQPRGFERQTMIEHDYAFSDRDGRQIKTNLLVFAHETFRSPDYRGLTVFNPANGIDEKLLAQSLAQSAAPFHLIHHHQTQRFSFWFTHISNKTSQQADAHLYETDIEYANLPLVIERYGSDINPQQIIAVNQGRDFFKHFEYEGAFQLALWAIEVTGPQLVQHFGRSVETLRRYNVPDETIPDVATQLLGATILAHTGKLGTDLRQNDPSLDNLIKIAHQEFPNYFNPNLFEQWQQAVEPAYKILTTLRYANFAPELLTQLYKEAFPDAAQRKELGRYDTPLYLTRRIWETIPVEFLPPEKRIVADMTCGWGSFLISGYERLNRMIDMENRPLRDHIFGNDNELFTARLAGLGLLISTLQDRWNISNQNALEWEGPNTQPTIIVGNPPFHGSRKSPSKEHIESSRRFEKANQFLDHAIDILAPDGYLAMLMPQSFVASGSSPELRQKLLQKYDILEMWDLPISAFDASVSVLVLIAQKKNVNGLNPVRVRTMQNDTYFRDSGKFTASSLVSNQSNWNEHARKSKGSTITHIMDYQVILPEYKWSQIHSKCLELEDIAFVSMGAIVGQSLTQKTWKNYPFPKVVPWLTGADIIPRPFSIAHELATNITYPNDFVRPGKYKRYPHDPSRGKEHLFMGKKVLIVSDPNPSWGKRVKVAIDRKGYYVSNTFYMVKSKVIKGYEHVTNEVLAAVLDWYVSNAWIVEHLKYPWVEKRIIQRLPFPKHLSVSDCRILDRAVQEIEFSESHDQERPMQASQAIDTILKKAYNIDEETFERLQLVSEWNENQYETLDQQIDPNAQWEISGVVDTIDAENGQITLWFSGFDELQTVPIVPVMPGWLLRPEVAFRTSIPRTCVSQRNLIGNTSWGFFYPQDYTYLDEEELLDQLAETLR